MTHRKQNITVISAEGHKNSSQLDFVAPQTREESLEQPIAVYQTC